ncbi:MAG: sugar ABC transporter ATP-binding protein [Candidatus Aminicenantes bacterium]|jgi:ribose transport system ATP-binding protein
MIQNQTSLQVLQMEKISKSFGATRALEDVNFELQRGEVHALIGENGAGKSTLVKILSGALKADTGRMFLKDAPYSPSSPLDGRRRGVSMIYQELNLAPHLTVEENIMLGKELHSWGFVRQKEMREHVKEALEFVHHPEISLDTPVKKLSIGARQVVEIARALMGKATVLIMDEPTSSLSQEDSATLFGIVRRLKEQGVSVIYISHFLEEVQEVADRFTVLRDGKKVGSGEMKDVPLAEIIRLMVGQRVDEMFPRVEHEIGDELLTLEKLKGKNMPTEVDLSLRSGEIIGLAGLVGAGRTELMRTIFGLDVVADGNVRIAAVSTPRASPSQRIRQGMGYLSEDRQREGLALSRSLADNLTLSHFYPYSRFGFLDLKKRKASVHEWIRRMKIKARDTEQDVLNLSGGNQQKVALARLLHQEADMLLLDEPTRGIDVASKSQIYEWIGQLASQGKTILFVSSYFPELIGICDRIAVFHRGQIVDIRPYSEWDTQSVMAAATTGKVVQQ